MSLRHTAPSKLSPSSTGPPVFKSSSPSPGSRGPSFPSSASFAAWITPSSKGIQLLFLTPVFAIFFVFLLYQSSFRRTIECSLPWASAPVGGCGAESGRDLMGAEMLSQPSVTAALQSLPGAEISLQDSRGSPEDAGTGEDGCRSPGLPLSPPLKVFMYDLPEKFNLGLIRQFTLNRGLPAENATYPAHQHSGEWWLYSDLVKPLSERRSACPPAAVRVMDPSQADVFFVPVFSSLSLVVNPLSMQRKGQLGPDAYDDVRMQHELMDWLEAQEPWQKSQGRDHIIPAQDPNSMWGVVARTKKAVLIVSDFGRLKPEEGNLLKDVVAPYVHRVATLTDEEARRSALGNRTTLLFFMGNRYRKDGGAVRNELFKVLDAEPDMLLREGLPTNEGRRASRDGMRTSKFCLHPAGDTPSACRMFDAIVNLCVPVVVSDAIELPFEDVLDYSKFSIFVPTTAAIRPGYLGDLLRSPEVQSRLPQMQEELQRVRHMFEWETEEGVVPQVWRKVATKVSWIREMVNRDRRLVPGAPGHCMWRCTARSGKRRHRK